MNGPRAPKRRSRRRGRWSRSPCTKPRKCGGRSIEPQRANDTASRYRDCGVSAPRWRRGCSCYAKRDRRGASHDRRADQIRGRIRKWRRGRQWRRDSRRAGRSANGLEAQLKSPIRGQRPREEVLNPRPQLIDELCAVRPNQWRQGLTALRSTVTNELQSSLEGMISPYSQP